MISSANEELIMTLLSSSQMPEHQGSLPWDYLAKGDNLSDGPFIEDECLHFPQLYFLLYLRTEKEKNLQMF